MKVQLDLEKRKELKEERERKKMVANSKKKLPKAKGTLERQNIRKINKQINKHDKSENKKK